MFQTAPKSPSNDCSPHVETPQVTRRPVLANRPERPPAEYLATHSRHPVTGGQALVTRSLFSNDLLEVITAFGNESYEGGNKFDFFCASGPRGQRETSGAGAS
jgi:hypothetical protein